MTAMINRRDDAIERALDEWWDGLTSGEAVPDDDMLSSVTTMTVEQLHADDDIPPPSATFVRLLRDDLVRDAPISTASWSPAVTDPTPLVPEPPMQPEPEQPKPIRVRRGKALVELAAVAVLVLGLISTAVTGSPLGALNLWPQKPTIHVTPDPTVGMYRGDAARTGVMPGPGPVGQPVMKWKEQFGNFGYVDLSVSVVANHTIYVVEEQRKLIAVDLMTGELLWRSWIGLVTQSEPAVGNGLVYIATAASDLNDSPGGYLIALDASTGAERWRYETTENLYSSPVLANEMVFVTPFDNTLRAVDAATGHERWRFDLATGLGSGADDNQNGAFFPASAAVALGIVYAADDNGRLFAIDAITGQERWRYQGDSKHLSTPTIVGDTVYVPTLRDANDLPTDIVLLDAKTGKERQTWSFDRNIRFPLVVTGDLVYATGTGDHNNGITAIDFARKRVAWTFEIDFQIPFAPVYADGVLYITGPDGTVYAIDGKKGTLIWRAYPGARARSIAESLTPPVVASSLVVVGSPDGVLYAIGGDGDTAALNAKTDRSFDVSGLPSCQTFVEPRIRLRSPDKGTPTASLEIHHDEENQGLPQLLLSEVPEGRRASRDEITRIIMTLDAMQQCMRPGMGLQLASFYTDDFLKRDWVNDPLTPLPGGDPNDLSLALTDGYGRPLTDVQDVRKLPDGRVAVVQMYDDSFGELIVFAKQDDHWFVDEILGIVPVLGIKG
jgi:outer membrane protein assembly factor BamB